MKGANMSNATAQMVTHPQAPRKKKAQWFRLRLVIDEVDYLHDRESDGYDLDNAKPWPLGHYRTEKRAIAARNSMVMVEMAERLSRTKG